MLFFVKNSKFKQTSWIINITNKSSQKVATYRYDVNKHRSQHYHTKKYSKYKRVSLKVKNDELFCMVRAFRFRKEDLIRDRLYR